jgi:ferredoxin
MVELTLEGPSGGRESCAVEAGSTILAASGRLKRPLASGCSDATCGSCRVEVLSGGENLAPPSEAERAALLGNGHPAAYRQGCRAEIVSGSVTVRGFEVV